MAKYNAEPVMPNPVMALDALYAIIDAIQKTNGVDPAKITEQLAKTTDVQGLSGKLTLDPATHNPLNKPAIIQVVKDGKITFKTKYVTQ
jgi:branched-chain amino acid transport system substrate-binding protein